MEREARKAQRAEEARGLREMPRFGPIVAKGRVLTAAEVERDYRAMLREVGVTRRGQRLFKETGDSGYLRDAIAEIAPITADKPLSDRNFELALLAFEWLRADGPGALDQLFNVLGEPRAAQVLACLGLMSGEHIRSSLLAALGERRGRRVLAAAWQMCEEAS